ncbi:MAG: pantetheine-phosphate adenylyltransferase [Gammaproteobacteria bacterium]|nr:pantetheine-phosphate adenylyltransferase [Gammaproteobacteria bacterium]
MATTAIYPGTFDPITNGHTNVLRRAGRLFDRIILAVVDDNFNKRCLFSTDERILLAETALDGLPGIEIMPFSVLLVEFAAQQKADAIIRGLRAVSDFEYEFQLAAMNRQLNNQIETIFMAPDERYGFISSSLIKEVAKFDGDISLFVDPAVNSALQGKFSDHNR